MKLRHIALAAACTALSSQAFALNAADTAAAPVKLYISGSSALAAVIEGLLNQPGNCVAGTYTKYTGLAGSAAGSGDTSNGNSHNAYSCTIATGSDFGTSFNGQNLAVVKREAGGSAFGVFPVATNADIDFINLSSCDDATKTCNAVAARKADAGVSDLEPVAFNSPANQPAAFAGQVVANSNFRSVTSVALQVFGLAVNQNLYNDLVAAQGTSSPSVPASAFASIFAAGYDATTLGWSPFGKNLPGKTNQVNLCSRGIGSGTRATAQINFLQLPYNPAAPSVAVPVGNTPGAVRGGNTAGAFFVSEESSTGNVVSCLTAATANGGYAIGIVGADRDLSTTTNRFVSLDGVAPGRATAKEGQYPWTYESFYNVNRTVVTSTALTLFPNAFGAAFKKPSNINAVSAAAANGVMATPVNCTGTTASDWTSPEEVAACSRVSRNKDSRLPLTFVK